ncbi:hypothetical protein KAR91_57090 [Candidatus Pacearchaeota archaeon]|nr:hypothetical protein [Candidatus Pacearchaeota archaeon]
MKSIIVIEIDTDKTDKNIDINLDLLPAVQTGELHKKAVKLIFNSIKLMLKDATI